MTKLDDTAPPAVPGGRGYFPEGDPKYAALTQGERCIVLHIFGDLLKVGVFPSTARLVTSRIWCGYRMPGRKRLLETWSPFPENIQYGTVSDILDDSSGRSSRIANPVMTAFLVSWPLLRQQPKDRSIKIAHRKPSTVQ